MKLSLFAMAATAAFALSAETLEWKGANGGNWTDAGAWADEAGNPTDWVDGATAVFGDLGGTAITVNGTVTPGGLVFKGSAAPVISGGTINFPAALPITLNDKGATISSALTLTDGFVATFTQPCEWPTMLPRSDGTGSYDAYVGREVTLYQNRTLTDLTFKSANLYTWKLDPLFAKAYHPKWKDGVLTIQFQYDTKGDDGVYCAYVEFKQKGADITARVVRVKSKRLDNAGQLIVLGADWDTLDYSGGSALVRDENGHDGGIGIKDFAVMASGALALNGAWTAVGACEVNNGYLKIEEGGKHQMASGSFTGNGGLILKNTAGTTPTFEIKGTFANRLPEALVVDGAFYCINGNSAKATEACGPGCDIRVINGGVLQAYLWAHNVLGNATSETPSSLYIGPNSTFWAWTALRNLRYVKTVVDGGTLKFTENANTSCMSLTLRNGAQVTEDNKTVGGLMFGDVVAQPVLTVDGESPVTVAAHIRIMKNPNGSWSANSQYTTFDTQQDLRLTGGLMTASTQEGFQHYTGFRVRKRGAAKLICDYSQDDYPENAQLENHIEICVDEGRLVLNKSNAIVATQNLSLYNAGEVEAAAGTTTSVGTLTVGGQNTISFAKGATLACTGLTLNDGNALALTGEFGETQGFRVGTTKCLSDAVLGRIRINGHRVAQTNEGYLIQPGLVLIFR